MNTAKEEKLVMGVHKALVGHDQIEIFIVLSAALGITMSDLAEGNDEAYDKLKSMLLKTLDRRFVKDHAG